MELGPKRPSLLWFWGPNSIMVVYVGPSGVLDSLYTCALIHANALNLKPQILNPSPIPIQALTPEPWPEDLARNPEPL